MTQPPEPEPLPPNRNQNDEGHDDMQADDLRTVIEHLALQAEQLRLERLASQGAEPFWMQDIRCAQRRIDAQRLRMRSDSKPAARPEEEG